MTSIQPPSLGAPAVEQAPVIEHVVKKARGITSEKSNLFWAVTGSYLLSIGAAIFVAVLISVLFGSPNAKGLLPGGGTLWRLGIPLSLFVSFFLGLILPFILANRRRIRAMFFTILLLFVTLVILVILGLTQLPSEEVLLQILS